MKLWSRFFLAACASTLVAWIVFSVAKERITAAIVRRFSEPLIKLSQGKISDPGLFVEHRLREALWLLALALFLVGVQWLISRSVRSRLNRNGWAAQGFAGFVLLNIWIGAAANTALFWGGIGLGAEVQNLTQFHFKRILMEDNSTSNRAVLVGSSQTRAQIDENLLNKLLGRCK